MSEVVPVQATDPRATAVAVNEGFASSGAWRVDLIPYLHQSDHINWASPVMDTNAIFGCLYKSSGAQNAAIWWDVMLNAGKWRFALLYSTDSDQGIISVTLDDRPITSIDTYSAGALYNSIQSVTSNSLTFERTAKRRLKFTMATKNAASSNYRGSIQQVQLTRIS